MRCFKERFNLIFRHQSNPYLLTFHFPVSVEALLALVVFAAPASLDLTSLESAAAAPANEILFILAFHRIFKA